MKIIDGGYIMHIGAKFEADYLYLGDSETLDQVKQKLESEYPLSLRMELNKKAGSLEISCHEYLDCSLQFVWNVMDLEDFAVSSGIKHYCGHGTWPSGDSGENYSFEVMELTEEQQKQYPDWVRWCTPAPVEQTVVGVLIGKNIAQCNQLSKGYWTSVPYSKHFFSFEVTLEQEDKVEKYIRHLPFKVDYAYYAYSYSDRPYDIYGPDHYRKKTEVKDMDEYIDSLEYLSVIDKACLTYAKRQLDNMLIPCDASDLPELYEINLEELGYELGDELDSSALVILMGENIKIPIRSPLRQQIYYDFKKDGKKVILLLDYSVNMNLDIEQLKDYGVQEAVCYRFKETVDDTHPRQYIIKNMAFELTQQLCEAIDRHLLIKKRKGWTYKNKNFLQFLDQAIDELQLKDTQLYHKPGIREWVYEETDDQIILKRYLYHYARINISTMYRKKQVVLDLELYYVTHLRFKLVEGTPLLILKLVEGTPLLIFNDIHIPYSNDCWIKKLLSVDLTNSMLCDEYISIPAEEIIGERIIVPEEK